jgi:hypothetical protein
MRAPASRSRATISGAPSTHTHIAALGGALRELGRRGEGTHESGAFVLGTKDRDRRRAVRFVYYDDLCPGALDTGIVAFDGAGYGLLWQLCHETVARTCAWKTRSHA